MDLAPRLAQRCRPGVLRRGLPPLARHTRPHDVPVLRAAALPFIILALVLALGTVLGPADAAFRRRWIGSVGVGAYLLVVIVMFFYFLPILSSMTLPYDAWYHGRAWFSTWV